jgi:Tfp pilus assembly pilus retraction ATPase PilT
MYDMNDLFGLMVSEGAESLSLHSGQPPVFHFCQAVEGPVLTPECAETILRSLATPVQVQEFLDHGTIDFIYTSRDSTQFRVKGKLQYEKVYVDLLRLEV